MDKIFLIDGHAQIFRMYYAFMRRPMVNSKGEDTSILFGFTKMILELIAKEHPTHLAVAFDPPAKTFRHEAFPQYKANRTAAPELVKEALEPLQEILRAFDIPVIMIPGYEADDVIGSMATQWAGPDNQIYMVTPDKDFGQLIAENIFQYKPAKGGNDTEIVGKQQICDHYGICSPQQVIDILTIWGDASDNVPGIRGIGEVGAKKLIGKYGNLNQLLLHVNELPEKQKNAIKEAADQIEMSRFLVTIKTDIPLPVSMDALKMQPINYSGIFDVFNKFEFNSLRKLLPTPDNNNSKGPFPVQANGNPENSLWDAETGAQPGISAQEAGQIEKTGISDQQKLPAIQEIAVDELLATALKNKEIAIKFIGEDTLILAVRDQNEESLLKTATILNLSGYASLEKAHFNTLKKVLEDSSVIKIGYGFKQYIKYLRSNEIELNTFLSKGKLEGVKDLEIMHYLINPERSHKEELLVKSYMDIDLMLLKSEKENPVGNKQKEAETYDLFSVPAEDEKHLAPDPFDITGCALLLPLHELIAQNLKKAGQTELYNTIEMPLIAVLSDMEWQGVKIDTAHLKLYSISLTKELNEIEQQARELAQDQTLNLSSPKQIGILLYDKLGLDSKVKKSARGNYPTDEETLTELIDSHPIISKILEFRALKKLLSTYIDNFPALISAQTGKIHTTFNQALTATGRLSSTNPNLQNIPIRTERGKEIRKAFIPSIEEGFIVSADYSQIELRLMAHMSGDKDLIEAFNNGKDIHTATAAKVFKVPENQVTKEQRSRAKVANFGIIYGISAFGLSQRLGMNRTESKQLIEEYFKNYPGVKEYINNMIQKAKDSGYVETIYGRRRFLPDINSRNAVVRNFNERNAINAPLQGSAADIIKVAMINVYNRLKTEKRSSKMILQVHDELIFDVVPEEVEQIKILVKEEMEKVIQLHIPLIADCNAGKNWLEAH